MRACRPPPFPFPELRFFLLGDACALDARDASTRNSPAPPRRPPSFESGVRFGMSQAVLIHPCLHLSSIKIKTYQSCLSIVEDSYTVVDALQSEGSGQVRARRSRRVNSQLRPATPPS